jgi:hypothetical protein
MGVSGNQSIKSQLHGGYNRAQYALGVQKTSFIKQPIFWTLLPIHSPFRRCRRLHVFKRRCHVAPRAAPSLPLSVPSGPLLELAAGFSSLAIARTRGRKVWEYDAAAAVRKSQHLEQSYFETLGVIGNQVSESSFQDGYSRAQPYLTSRDRVHRTT